MFLQSHLCCSVHVAPFLAIHAIPIHFHCLASSKRLIISDDWPLKPHMTRQEDKMVAQSTNKYQNLLRPAYVFSVMIQNDFFYQV